jgi:hypothetical protein
MFLSSEPNTISAFVTKLILSYINKNSPNISIYHAGCDSIPPFLRSAPVFAVIIKRLNISDNKGSQVAFPGQNPY